MTGLELLQLCKHASVLRQALLGQPSSGVAGTSLIRRMLSSWKLLQPAGGLESAQENAVLSVELDSSAAGRIGARSRTGISVTGRHCCWYSALQAVYGAWKVGKSIFFRSRSFRTFSSAFTSHSLLMLPCWLRAVRLGSSQLGSGRRLVRAS